MSEDQALIKERVIEAIKTVYDPEIPVDVYELGLIYEVSIFPVNETTLTLFRAVPINLISGMVCNCR